MKVKIMVSVSKLDSDENHSLIIILDKKEFKTFSKKFRKITGYKVEAFFDVKYLSKNTIKLTPKLNYLSDKEVEVLANVTSKIIEEIGEYKVSIDGLMMIIQKLKYGKTKITKQLKYSIKVVSKLLRKHTLVGLL